MQLPVAPTPFLIDFGEMLKQYLVLNFLFLLLFVIAMGVSIAGYNKYLERKDKKKK